ncbi:helix-turn-helix domain-containing protein, partial [Pseudomonas aeruginosa]
PASGEPRRGLRSAAAVELLTSFCLCFLKKPVRQDGVYGAVTVLQRSLHAFLANGCNVTQTAEALGTHRNTLLRRLERAQDLLPVRLADHRIQIAAALELVIWSTPLVDDDK